NTLKLHFNSRVKHPALLCSGEACLGKPRSFEGTAMKKLLWVATAFLTFLYCAGIHAADIIWTNISGGTWSTALNWNPNQVPTTNDTVWITNNGTYSVTISANAGATNLVLGGTSGAQTLNHTAGVLTLATGGSSSANGAYALSGTATLTGG